MLKASGPTGSNQRAASSSAFPLLASPGLAGWRAGPAGPHPVTRGRPCCSAMRLGWGRGLGITRGGWGGPGGGLVNWVGYWLAREERVLWLT